MLSQRWDHDEDDAPPFLYRLSRLPFVLLCSCLGLLAAGVLFFSVVVTAVAFNLSRDTAGLSVLVGPVIAFIITFIGLAWRRRRVLARFERERAAVPKKRSLIDRLAGSFDARAIALDRIENRFRRAYPAVMLGIAYQNFMGTISVFLFVPSVILILMLTVVVFLLQSIGVGTTWGHPPALSALVKLPVYVTLFVGFVFAIGYSSRNFGKFSAWAGATWVILLLALQVTILGHFFPNIVAFVREVAARSPVGAVALVSATVVCEYCTLLVLFAAAEGTIAIFRASPAERTLLKQAITGSPVPRTILSQMLGLPPLFGFVQGKARKAAIIVLSSLSAYLTGAICINIASAWFVLLYELNRIAERCGASDIGNECLGRELTSFLIAAGPFFALAMIVFIAVAAISNRMVNRLVRTSIEELLGADHRAPVLFLRAFRDDQVHLRPPKVNVLGRFLELGRRKQTLDTLLLEELTTYGPVVALGHPRDKSPPYGVARGYFEERTWQQVVSDLAKGSSAIVVCLDDTESIWWEVDHLRSQGHLGKTLFLIHPKHATFEANGKLLGRLHVSIGRQADASVDGSSPPRQKGQVAPSTVGLFLDDAGEVRYMKSSTFSRISFLLAIRLFARGYASWGPGVAPRT